MANGAKAAASSAMRATRGLLGRVGIESCEESRSAGKAVAGEGATSTSERASPAISNRCDPRLQPITLEGQVEESLQVRKPIAAPRGAALTPVQRSRHFRILESLKSEGPSPSCRGTRLGTVRAQRSRRAEDSQESTP